MTSNRLVGAPGLSGFIAVVAQLVDAVVRRDRWAIARRATGPLLVELLAGSYDSYFGVTVGPGASIYLDGTPVVLVDNGIAVVIAPVIGPHLKTPVAVTALLVQSTTTERSWFVASLTQDELLDNAFQRRVQQEEFPIENDIDIIAAHGPLDDRAASIDWDDDSVVLNCGEAAIVSVADARTELANWDRSSWHWLADDCHNFSGLYLRGRHPDLVREFPSHSGDRR